MTDSSKGNYAGFWRRYFAYCVDIVIISFIAVGVQMLFGASPFSSTIAPQSLLHYGMARIVLPYISGLVVMVFFWVVTNGSSPGKWLMHIRIIRVDGQPMNVRTALVRYIGYWVSGLFFNYGYVYMLFDVQKQTVHDKIAKTYVIVNDNNSPSILAYIIGIIGPVMVLAVYFWVMLVSHGLVETVSDFRAIYKDFQVVNELRQIKPEVRKHMDKAQGYITQVEAIDLKDPEYATKVRPIARQAVEELKLARDLDPKNVHVYVQLANTYAWLDGDPAAEKAYENAATVYRMDPDNSQYACLVANALMGLKRYDEAVTMYQKAIVLDHVNAVAYQGLGTAYQYLKQFDLAVKNYRKTIDIYQKKGKHESDVVRVQGYINTLTK